MLLKKTKKKANQIPKRNMRVHGLVGYQKKPDPSAGRENERNRLDMRDHLNLSEKETRQ